MGRYLLKGRKTNSILVTWKERVIRVNTEGAVTKLVSVFSPHFPLCISFTMYTDWQVNISNPDTSSVFHICISTYLLTLPLRSFRIFQICSSQIPSSSLILFQRFPSVGDVTSLHSVAQNSSLGHLQHLFLPQSPIYNSSTAC